jgi:hypothetical protein
MRRALAFLILPALLGCGARRTARTIRATPAAPPPFAIGRPVAPETVRGRVLPPGTIELRAGSWFLEVVQRPGANPRDVCVEIGIDQRRGDADQTCAVSAGRLVSFAAVHGSTSVIAGVAAQGVRSVKLGGTPLPLSAHRAFLAVVTAGTRARLQLVVDGSRVRTLELPQRPAREPHHAHRRRGAVFNDEIGESITLLSYKQLVARFGPPATASGRCVYYELVGDPRDGWRFCFTAAGRMRSATGRSPPPWR